MSQVRHEDFWGFTIPGVGGSRGVLALALAQIGLCHEVLTPSPSDTPPLPCPGPIVGRKTLAHGPWGHDCSHNVVFNFGSTNQVNLAGSQQSLTMDSILRDYTCRSSRHSHGISICTLRADIGIWYPRRSSLLYSRRSLSCRILLCLSPRSCMRSICINAMLRLSKSIERI